MRRLYIKIGSATSPDTVLLDPGAIDFVSGVMSVGEAPMWEFTVLAQGANYRFSFSKQAFAISLHAGILNVLRWFNETPGMQETSIDITSSDGGEQTVETNHPHPTPDVRIWSWCQAPEAFKNLHPTQANVLWVAEVNPYVACAIDRMLYSWDDVTEVAHPDPEKQSAGWVIYLGEA